MAAEAVLAHIDAHLDRSIRLEELAQAAGFSRMHFARQFRLSTGLPAHEFVIRRRVELAKLLLRHSDTSVAEIACSTGFRSQPHFTRVFHRLVGLPPAAWRRSHRAADSTGLRLATGKAGCGAVLTAGP